MNFKIRKAELDDYISIMKIENAVFQHEEAASHNAMKNRIIHIQDSFLVAVDTLNDNLAGYIVGPIIQERYLYDELFENTSENPKLGGFQSVLSLAVDKEYQGKRIASLLLSEYYVLAKSNKREGITLTCLKELVPFYEKQGFIDEGQSVSTHGGKLWVNMVRMID
ncbi:GNAT family N-acetyltransferase [Erysipelothrix anatis]|uniref:GNAT family N-acetyltransferase n=1 Tax=Erysipelothrix anatis TaxID=2683713 RepID=UPI001408A351|nr:GNAT family N-acetyltransferase [Erysipelothrix anatis]